MDDYTGSLSYRGLCLDTSARSVPSVIWLLVPLAAAAADTRATCASCAATRSLGVTSCVSSFAKVAVRSACVLATAVSRCKVDHRESLPALREALLGTRQVSQSTADCARPKVPATAAKLRAVPRCVSMLRTAASSVSAHASHSRG